MGIVGGSFLYKTDNCICDVWKGIESSSVCMCLCIFDICLQEAFSVFPKGV